ncbi:hypothetical protein AGLY_009021 [Aphis glycines]|uniref:Helitron helicase-like domain-containing protein n=1 Tax=Aphis glycines TaxID=307491 RepID=A0A6G0TK34_APHGL|nr:hypothetical protein AGLY_009021 [Aphis glycines]
MKQCIRLYTYIIYYANIVTMETPKIWKSLLRVSFETTYSIVMQFFLNERGYYNNNHNNQNEPRVPWRQRFMSAFNYNKSIDYRNDSHVSIGNMNTKWNFCRAFKWPKQPSGLCCSGGKVLLAEIADPPKPLKSLLNHSHRDSKHFLDMIRVYNSAFQMTSFGANEIRHGDLMPTFKIQGQVYHLVGSLLPNNPDEPNFLQLYFMGDSVSEVNWLFRSSTTVVARAK